MSEGKSVSLSRYAMGTEFELLLPGEDKAYLRAAGEEALNEIARLEAQLSLYRSDSDISELNANAASGPVRVEPRLFALLQYAAKLTAESEGAFDITVAPLMRCWGFIGASGQMPTAEAVAEAHAKVGMHHVFLNETESTVQFDRDGVMLDFGAIGKGYAIERAVDILRDYEITSALLHGGTSTVYALGAPPDAEGWKVAIHRPFSDDPDDHLATVELRDTALSVSAPHGKWFLSEGKRYGHVIDPRTGYPATRNILAALITGSATDSDALSTALLTLGSDWLPTLTNLRPDARACVVIENSTGGFDVKTSASFLRIIK